MHEVCSVHKLVNFRTASSKQSLGIGSCVTDSMTPLPGVDSLL